MKIQEKEVKIGQTIRVSGVVGRVIEIDESFLKNGKRLCRFRLDCPERKKTSRGVFASGTSYCVKAKIIWTDCRETTIVTTY